MGSTRTALAFAIALAACGGEVGSDGSSRDASVDATPEVPTIPPPRAIAPMSTATVTSQRPTLRWSLADGTDGARVDICRDRACRTLVTTFLASGSNGAPPNALAAGVYFWRLHGVAKGIVGSPTSPTWEFFVGARSAPVDTSWGTIPDVNGDGFADVLVGGNGEAVYVYDGGGSGLVTTPFALTKGAGALGTSFGSTIASAGDLDGDGFSDVVVSAVAMVGAGDSAEAFVYLGGEGGLSATPSTTISLPFATTDDLETSVAAAGDLNGDGYADLLVSSSCAGCTSQLFVYEGASTGLASTPTTTLAIFAPSANQVPSIAVASAGDVNGDGFADVVVGVVALGEVEVFSGSATGISPAPSLTITIPRNQVAQLGGAVAAAGDVDGDGFADVAVRADGVSLVPITVYAGSAAGLSASPAATVRATTGNDGICCGAIAGGGDVNGDGFDDLVVDAHRTMTTGAADVYLGGPSGLATTASTTLTNPSTSLGPFGATMANAGDVNGDGFADVLVSGANGADGQAFLYLGGSTGLPASPSVTLDAPSGANTSGFGSVSALSH